MIPPGTLEHGLILVELETYTENRLKIVLLVFVIVHKSTNKGREPIQSISRLGSIPASVTDS